MAGTTVYNINKPTVAGDSGVWGGFLNTGMDTIDNEIARSRIPFVSPTYNVAGTTTLDLNQTTGGRVFAFTVSGASTLAFSNVPAATFAVPVQLKITNGGAFVLTFPASVTWLPGSAPVFKASGVDWVTLWTTDAGTTWYASHPVSTIFQKTNVNTSSTSEVSITSYVLPGGGLAVNGQMLRVLMRGNATGQPATAHINFGVTTMTSALIAAGEAFTIEWMIARSGAANQLGICTVTHGTTLQVHSRVTPTESLTANVTIDFRGAVTSGGTLNVDVASVELLTV